MKENEEEPGRKRHFKDKRHFKSLQTEINFHWDEQLPRRLFLARLQNKYDYIDHPYLRFFSGGVL